MTSLLYFKHGQDRGVVGEYDPLVDGADRHGDHAGVLVTGGGGVGETEVADRGRHAGDAEGGVGWGSTFWSGMRRAPRVQGAGVSVHRRPHLCGRTPGADPVAVLGLEPEEPALADRL